MSMLHIHLFGDFHIVYGAVPVLGIDTPRLQSVLAYLLLHRDAPQSRAHLSYLFWPNSTEAQARMNLRKQIYHLRRALPDADRFLHADRQVLQWQSGALLKLDVADLNDALDQAERAERAGHDGELQEALERAVALYRGDLLPSCYDDWVLEEREQYRQRFVRSLERLIQVQASRRDYSAAIEAAQRLLRHDPLHEVTYRTLMDLQALSGNRAAALRTYHICAKILQTELSVAPSAATRQVYERLLKLDAVPARAAEPLAPGIPLVGRDREWANLRTVWRTASGHLVLLTGEAGIGKTRLAEELLAWASRQGIPSASAHCYASESGLAYAPVTAWLRTDALQENLPSLDEMWLSEVARLLPELLVGHPEIPPPGPLTESWQRQRLFEALARAFFAQRQLLLLLDDLQWCDRETLQWLPYLLHAHGSARLGMRRPARLLVVGTMRTEEMPDDGQLGSVLRDLRRSEQLTKLEVGPLSEAEILSLATHVAGRELDPALAASLSQGSEGNPLFVVEMVRAGRARGEQWIAAHDLPLPPKVQSVIEARLSQLSPPARELVGAAATIGREFIFDVLARTHGADPEILIPALDELWQRRILREQGAEAYDFSHDKIREVAYAGLSAARRRSYHRRAAWAMETVYATDLDTVSGQVAAHYEQAGEPEKAISHYQRAAEAARRIYANEEAVRHLCRAIGLLPMAGHGGAQAARLHGRLGDILALIGNYEEAEQAYQVALAQAPATDKLWRARLQCQLANTWQSRHHYRKAGSAYDAALQQLGHPPASLDPGWWQTWLDIQLARADMLYFASDLTEMARLCRDIEPVVTAHGSAKQQANFYHALVMRDNRLSRFRPSAETIAHISKALALARETGDPQFIAHKTFGLGFSSLWYGDLETAREQMTIALTHAERTGNVFLQDRCLTYLSVLYRLKGDLGQARAYTERGLEAAAAEGAPLYVGVAKANLAWLHYRAGTLDEAVREGRVALDQWRSFAYPLAWLAHWPLLAVATSRGQTAQAMDHARAMLDPGQQRLPEPLTAALEEAVHAWDEGRPESAHERLTVALHLAHEMGHL